MSPTCKLQPVLRAKLDSPLAPLIPIPQRPSPPSALCPSSLFGWGLVRRWRFGSVARLPAAVVPRWPGCAALLGPSCCLGSSLPEGKDLGCDRAAQNVLTPAPGFSPARSPRSLARDGRVSSIAKIDWSKALDLGRAVANLKGEMVCDCAPASLTLSSRPSMSTARSLVRSSSVRVSWQRRRINVRTQAPRRSLELAVRRLWLICAPLRGLRLDLRHTQPDQLRTRSRSHRVPPTAAAFVHSSLG